MEKRNLKTEYPEVAKQWHPVLNGDNLPEDFAPFSGKKVWWLCSVCGYEWQTAISTRTTGEGCPACGRKRVAEKLSRKNLIPGVNDFRTKCPEAAKQWHSVLNEGRGPEEFSPFSGHKAWWHCEICGGDWEALISSRANGRGCPYCSSRKVLPGFNDLESQYPDIAREWHPEKNGELRPSEVMAHSNRRIWWRCCVCAYEWDATVNDRTNGHSCPKCGNKAKSEKLTKKNLIPGVNDLKTLHPELAAEWDHTRNKDGPEDYSEFSVRKKWWICPKGHSYNMYIANRTGQRQGCPYCGSRKVLAGFNDLQTLYPEIAAEWDYEKNEKKPSEVMSKSSYRAYWICPQKHSFRTMVSERTTNDKTEYCPICSGKQVLAGYNDLATVCPEIAAQWDWEKNGDLRPTDVTEFSAKKVWWICEKGHSWKALISGRSRGNGCPYCSNAKLLQGFNDVATLFPDVAKEWSPENKKRPDEYIAGSHSRVKWICSKCGHEWSTVIKERTYAGRGCPQCVHYLRTSVPEQAIFFYMKQAYPDAVNAYIGDESGGWEIDVYVPSLSLGVEYDGGYWHSKPDTDIRKTRPLQEKGIDLIRIREKQADPLDDGSIHILTDTSTDDLNKLKPALEELFGYLSSLYGLKETPDIDLDRDFNEILAVSEGNKYERSLAATNSPLLQEWDYEKNAPVTPDNVTAHSNRKAWWICSKCGKSWRQKIGNKFKGGLYCETCSKKNAVRKRVSSGLESGKLQPLTDYPLLVQEWADERDISMFSRGSNQTARWQCSKCGTVFYQVIRNRTGQGQGCPACWEKRRGETFKREVKNLETGEVFASVMDAAEKYRVSYSVISACARGKLNTAAGFHWAYSRNGEVDPENELPEQLSFFDEHD